MATKAKRYEGLDGAWIWKLNRAHWNMLIAPHAAFFEKHGVALHAAVRDADWVVDVHSVLLKCEAELPASLSDAFAEIIPLSNEQAGDQFRQLALQHKLDLGAAPETLSDAELAVRFYLHHRNHFTSVYAHSLTSLPTIFAEFFDPTRADLAGRVHDASMKELRQSLSQHWKQRERTGFADAQYTESAKEHSFLVVHGDTVKSVGRIDPATLRRDQLRYTPDRHDTIHIEKGTGRLSIHTAHQADVEQYRSLFGQVFFKNTNQFSACARYTGAPLLDLGPKALSVEGIAGLEKVTLLACTLGESTSSRRRRTVSFTGAALAADLELLRLTAARFGADHVDSLKLSLKLAGSKREVPVNLRCTEDRTKLGVGKREKLDIVYRFLAARGFSVPPVLPHSKAA